MTFKALAFAAGLALAAGSAGQAFAAQHIAFYRGVVTSGYDMTGLFGQAGASLAGDSYTEYFYIDTSKGMQLASSTSLATMGGSSLGLTAPVSASLTINGHTQTVSGGFYGLARTGYNSLDGQYEIFDTAQDASVSRTGMTSNSITGGIASGKAGVIPVHYDGYDIKVDGATTVSLPSSFMFHTVNLKGADVVDTYGVLQAVSAAPEPASWALMLVGLGGVGLMLRRARSGAASRIRSALAA